MVARSHLRGHPTEYIDGRWVYSDTKEPTSETSHLRGCGYCGCMETPEGHDACLGTLPGVMNACCGHGINRSAYVQFLDGNVLDGEPAAKLQEILVNNDVDQPDVLVDADKVRREIQKEHDRNIERT